MGRHLGEGEIYFGRFFFGAGEFFLGGHQESLREGPILFIWILSGMYDNMITSIIYNPYLCVLL